MHVCSFKGCPVITDKSRCQAHERSTQYGWGTKHGQNAHRIRGPELQTLRAILFSKYPMCQACGERPSVIRDHKVPIAEGGTEDESNIWALCQECSDAKTQQEAQRGRARNR